MYTLTDESFRQAVAQYWDESARHDYDDQHGHGLHSDAEVAAWRDLLARLLPGGGWTLDVGCGTGILAMLLAEMGHRMIGVDLSQGMLMVARGKRADIVWMLGDAGRLPLPDGSLDALVARHLLWTLPQPVSVLAEWRRALRSGGRALFIEGYWWDQGPVRRTWGALMRRLAAWRRGQWGVDTDILYGPEMDAQLPLVRRGARDLTVDAVHRAGYTVQDVFDLANIHRAERASASWRQRIQWGVTLRYAILATPSV